MSVAIIQGAAGSQGLALASHILRHTGLKVYALTHGKAKHVEEELYKAGGKEDRLTVLGDVDVKEETGLEKAAKTVGEREGKGSVRLVACMAGVLQPEKSLAAINLETALDSFRINALGHLVTYKHFVPLIPTRQDLIELLSGWKESEDPAKGLISCSHSLCWSMSARVGSIWDNEKGGWYSYRASKAAVNQIIRCLDHELVNKSSSGIAIAYHPGTVLTSFSKRVVGQDAQPDPDNGRFTVDQALDCMTGVMSQIRRDGDWGGGFVDWSGKRVQW